MSETPEEAKPSPSPVTPMWGISAKVVQERRVGPGGKEIKRGTNQFHTGAKVYVADWLHDSDSVRVVGHYRGQNYATAVVRVEHLENFRPELIYSPTVIERIKATGSRTFDPLDGSDEAKQKVTELAANLANRARNILDMKLGRWAAKELIESRFASCGGVFHAHGKSAQFMGIAEREGEKAQDILMCIFVWALYLPQYPDLQVDTVVDHRRHVVQMDASVNGKPKYRFLGTVGLVSYAHMWSVVCEYPATHTAIAWWHYPLADYQKIVDYHLAGNRHTAPIDLIRIPERAEGFIDADGNVTISFDDVEWLRLENQLGGE